MTAEPGAPGTADSWLVRAGNFLFRYRNYAFPLLLIPLVVLFAPLDDGEGRGGTLDALVILLAVLGQGLRAAVVGLAYIKRGGLNKRVYAKDLVTEGLFAHCRNPLYVGNLLLLLALLVIVNNLWAYVIGGGFFVFAYVAIVAAEEKYLRGKFGAGYEEYCRRVNRWIPDFRGIGATLASMSFNWRRVLLKEYSSFYSWTVVALLLETVKALRHADTAMAEARLAMLGALFAAATAVFLTVYFLKKTRRLVDRAV
ncbi:MAG TPA: isoprenylcysteine carboxylmethyltransferase family protein [Alphaproteobacteria bacterium]|nr:isoprenylcysteine carboxylmethyltransferase family protein [Alphaproteobacteria bacterium]